MWLQTEALVQNPKIEVSADKRFSFKPMYKIKDKKSMLRLLKQHDLKGLGGILMEDIQESLPHCEKHMKVNIHSIIYLICLFTYFSKKSKSIYLYILFLFFRVFKMKFYL